MNEMASQIVKRLASSSRRAAIGVRNGAQRVQLARIQFFPDRPTRLLGRWVGRSRSQGGQRILLRRAAGLTETVLGSVIMPSSDRERRQAPRLHLQELTTGTTKIEVLSLHSGRPPMVTLMIRPAHNLAAHEGLRSLGQNRIQFA